MGWGDDVFVGARPQGDSRANTYRQRNLKGHNRTDEYHRQHAANQQDRLAPLYTLIQTDRGLSDDVFVRQRAVGDVGLTFVVIDEMLWSKMVFR